MENLAYTSGKSYTPTNSVYQTTRPVKIDWKKCHVKILKLSKKKSKEYNLHEHVNYTSFEEKKEIENSDEKDIYRNFWWVVDKIQWCDVDEKKLTPDNITNRYTKNECVYLYETMNTKLIPQLKAVLSNTALFDNLDTKSSINIMAHIIMKGEAFYNGIIENPDVSLYLIDQFYPVYDWISIAL